MKIQFKSILSAIICGFFLLFEVPSVSAQTLNEIAKLLASDGAAFDQFGVSVAVDGDTAVIGAHRHDDDDIGMNSGSAYVFTRSGTTWTQQAKLIASDDGAAEDLFGRSVAVAGDTAVIGVVNDDDSGTESGSAYVFTRSGTTWTQQAKLTASVGAAGDRFGSSVAVDGDTAVIGAFGNDGNGSAYVFTRSGSTWTQQAKLTASVGASGDQFGSSVAVEGDTAVIGAFRNDGNGSAYVFTRSGTTWTQQAKLTASDGTPNDQFGRSVAVDGDTAVIAAVFDDDNGNASGSAYVYTRSAAVWTERQKLLASDAAADDRFGSSVAVNGDTVVIGASGNDGNGTNSGSAYLFTRNAGMWIEQQKLLASDAAAGDGFGSSVAMDGDTAVIGAVVDDDKGTNSGSAYVFDLVDGPVADAGPDQTRDEALLVTLDGSASTGATNYAWSQLAGPTVTLSSTTVVNPSFTAPYVPSNMTSTFQLIVDDGSGNFSDPDTVNVTIVNVNNPPVADAGDDGTIKEGAVATLDGSNSFDPEGDAPLGYSWTQTVGIPVSLQPGNTIVSPTFTAPSGVGNQLTFELEVDDGKEFSDPDDAVIITVVANSAPVADAGPDQTRNEASSVQLDGTGSSDPDGGDTISYLWTQVAGTGVALNNATLATPSFDAPAVGAGGDDLVFSVVVTDDDPVNPKSSMPDEVTISVRNINDPPGCDLARASCPESKIKNNGGCTLWPPNHKLVPVSIEGVMDADSVYNDVTLQITGVTQDEPVNGTGDGDTSPDAVIQTADPADSVLIRAERTGPGNGRVYKVNITADDGFESCTGSVTIGVPHNRKGTPVDDGQVFDSTQP